MSNIYTKKDGQLAFVFAVVASIVLAFILGSSPYFAQAEVGSAGYWIMQFVYTLGLGAVAFLYASINKKNVLVATKMHHAPGILHVLFVVVATLFLIFFSTPVNGYFMQLLVDLGFSEPSVDLPLQWPLLIALVGIVAPVCEELVFRGTIANGLADDNPWRAVLWSGVLFSIFHMNPAQTLHQFLLGCLLAFAMLRSGSVWVAVIGHAVNNLFALFCMAVNVEDWIANNVVLCIVGGAIGAGVVVFLYAKHTSWKHESTKTAGDATPFFVIAIVFCVAMWLVSLCGVA